MLLMVRRAPDETRRRLFAGEEGLLSKLTGVVPCPAVLAPGEDVANVMAKPPFTLSALSMELYQYENWKLI